MLNLEPLLFSLGWVIALYIFSPDTDMMPKKRAGIFGFFLYPYSLLFKHRGVSHSLWLGTLSRILFLLITAIFWAFILDGMGYIDIDFAHFFSLLLGYLTEYQWSEEIYRYPTLFYLGMVGADTTHILLDWWSSFFGKLKREVL